MKLKKTIVSIIALSGIIMLSTGCSKAVPKPIPTCIQEEVAAPQWICSPNVKGMIVDIGIAKPSKLGLGFTKRAAMADGRSNLSQQISVLVKDKVEVFMRSTGIGEREAIDSVSTHVSKQVSKLTLNGSTQLQLWESPSKTLYLLVGMDKDNVIESTLRHTKSTFKSDDALWQQYQSENSLSGLEAEFE